MNFMLFAVILQLLCTCSAFSVSDHEVRGIGPLFGHTCHSYQKQVFLIGGKQNNEKFAPALITTLDVSGIATRVLADTPRYSNVKGHVSEILTNIAYHSSVYVSQSDTFFVFGGKKSATEISDAMYSFRATSPGAVHLVPTTGHAPGARFAHCAVAIGTKIFIFGGSDGAAPLADLYVYDTTSSTFTKIDSKTNGPEARHGHSCVVYKSTSILVAGGTNEGNDDKGELWEFDTLTYEWSLQLVHPLLQRRAAAAVAAADQTAIFIIGGINGTTALDDGVRVATRKGTEKVRFHVETFLPKRNIPAFQSGCAAYLNFGEILLFGGAVSQVKFFRPSLVVHSSVIALDVVGEAQGYEEIMKQELEAIDSLKVGFQKEGDFSGFVRSVNEFTIDSPKIEQLLISYNVLSSIASTTVTERAVFPSQNARIAKLRQESDTAHQELKDLIKKYSEVHRRYVECEENVTNSQREEIEQKDTLAKVTAELASLRKELDLWNRFVERNTSIVNRTETELFWIGEQISSAEAELNRSRAVVASVQPHCKTAARNEHCARYTALSEKLVEREQSLAHLKNDTKTIDQMGNQIRETIVKLTTAGKSVESEFTDQEDKKAEERTSFELGPESCKPLRVVGSVHELLENYKTLVDDTRKQRDEEEKKCKSSTDTCHNEMKAYNESMHKIAEYEGSLEKRRARREELNATLKAARAAKDNAVAQRANFNTQFESEKEHEIVDTSKALAKNGLAHSYFEERINLQKSLNGLRAAFLEKYTRWVDLVDEWRGLNAEYRVLFNKLNENSFQWEKSLERYQSARSQYPSPESAAQQKEIADLKAENAKLVQELAKLKRGQTEEKHN